MDVFFSKDFIRDSHSFDTTAKAGWIADSLSRQSFDRVSLTEPIDLKHEHLSVVHTEKYIDAIKTGLPLDLASSNGLKWDNSLFPCVFAHNAGIVAAALKALDSGISGSLSSGLHHARKDKGNGFCTFNGLVIAAMAALNAGASRVLIIDFDAHGGGGTNSLILNEPRIVHLDISVNSFDSFVPAKKEDCSVLVSDSSDYCEQIFVNLQNLNNQTFDLCLYNAGVDPDQRCKVGGLQGITEEVLRERDRYVFEWCRWKGIPVAFALAGGYINSETLSKQQLVNLHLGTIVAASKTESIK